MKVNPKTVKFALDLVAAIAEAISGVLGNHLASADQG